MYVDATKIGTLAFRMVVSVITTRLFAAAYDEINNSKLSPLIWNLMFRLPKASTIKYKSQNHFLRLFHNLFLISKIHLTWKFLFKVRGLQAQTIQMAELMMELQ